MTLGRRVELVHLGTGHALPDGLRGPTATLLRTASQSVLVDVGSGTLQKLHAAGGDIATLDALLLTHAHLDHVADLGPLLFALAVPGMERVRPLRIVGSHETLRLAAAWADVFGRWMRPPDHTVEWVPITPGDSLPLGQLVAHTAPVAHTASSVGFAVTCGDVRVAIPGDSGPCDGLLELLDGADYAVLECSLPDALALDGHLTPASFAAAVNTAGPREVAVVHRYPAAAGDDVRAQLLATCRPALRFPVDGDRVIPGVR